MKRGIGKEGVFSYREPLSVWYVFIPSNDDREAYIKNCNRTGTITVINENAEVVNKVKIGKVALQKIKYPENQDEVGSPLLVGNILSKNQLVVMDVFDFEDDFDELLESETAMLEKTSTGAAEVRAQGEKGIVYINVDSELEDGGKVIINVSNADGSGEVQLNVDGDVSVRAGGSVTAISNTGISAIVRDRVNDKKVSQFHALIDSFTTQLSEFDDDDNELLYYKETIDGTTKTEERYDSEGELIWSRVNDGVTSTEKFFVDGSEKLTMTKDGESVLIGDDGEKMVLGETLAQLLKDVITEISISTTSAGPLLNAAKISAFVSQVDSILSAYSKTQ